ncbi:uncharacterized protein PADG_12391 [Paracoccidioides brasiliensis Pb18]|uniref:Uncharacterized protein n=1 Tax=Paracoccidioides brasiliensis (strain Pb18) TaxID=502780 RepID=A0A0A0HT98_PARBD|nr:uncharacterized protein PADG_12391 [Paracoccidioides brasiliensis Pb18]KGM91533.1 hypothetical protein PADG_12391 [Paracoccidioides brasiliensis Pb18]
MGSSPVTEWKWDESKGAIAALHDAAPLVWVGRISVAANCWQADFTSTQKLSPSCRIENEAPKKSS